MRTFVQGARGLILDPEAKAGCKAQSAKDPQSILVETHRGLTYRTDDAGFKIFSAAEKVYYLPIHRQSHSVYGKITAGQILGQLGGEADLIGMSAVGVTAIQTEGGHLGAVITEKDGKSTVLYARVIGAKSVTEAGLHLLGQSRGADIVVTGGKTKKAVAYATAYKIRFVTALTQSAKYV
jgi:hypothetical protein